MRSRLFCSHPPAGPGRRCPAAAVALSCSLLSYPDPCRDPLLLPCSLQVQADDALLQQVALPETACQGTYQQARLQAIAAFGGDGLDTIPGLWVTPLVEFASSDAAMASVSGSWVRGEAPGEAVVTLRGHALPPGVLRAQGVTVTEARVEMERLEMAAVTNLEWEPLAAQVPRSGG